MKVFPTTADTSLAVVRSTSADVSRRARLSIVASTGPCSVFLVLAFAVPVAYVFALSVTEPSLSLGNFRRVLTSLLYLRIIWHTFAISFLIALACIVAGYPVAYVMARRTGMLATLLLAAVAISFWTSFLVRTYAWLVILGSRGPVASTFQLLGLGAMPPLLFTTFSSSLGMGQILLPYMILSLYGVMRQIEPNYVRAAEGLGARPFTAFRLVYLPLSLPGAVSGTILVFTLCLGFYVTPVLLGAPRDMMVAQLISQQVDELLNWGLAAALAVVLLAATVLVLAAYDRFFGLDRLWG